MSEKKKTDWEAIEREYRAGQFSVSEIARLHGISHTAINKRAKRDGWTKNLAARVKELVSTKLVSEGVSASSARETIELAAERDIQLVREHRSDIKQGRRAVQLLISELQQATEYKEEVEGAIETETEYDANLKRRAAMLRAVSLSSRSTAAASLSVALKNLVALERQAFNLDSGKIADSHDGGIDAPPRSESYDDWNKRRSIEIATLGTSAGAAARGD